MAQAIKDIINNYYKKIKLKKIKLIDKFIKYEN